MPTTPEPAPLEETPDMYGAYPRLSPEQIRTLAALGERHEVRAGEVLYEEDDTSCDFFVILEGKVAVVDSSGGVVAVHGPGRFVGDTLQRGLLASVQPGGGELGGEAGLEILPALDQC